MRVVDMGSRMQALGVSVAVAFALAWLRSRRERARCDSSKSVIAAWKQLPPPEAKDVEAKDFGETDLQAKLVTTRLPVSEMRMRANAFFELMNTRRTMRFYSSDDVPMDVLESCLATAGTSPSGAHHQPWFFAVVRNGAIKKRIRDLVEDEEKVNYERRMRKSWVQDLASMTGNKSDSRLRTADGAPQKPYLTEAPVILAMFKQTHCIDASGKKIDNYYVNESCGIAAGILIAALHNVGLATLTSTPMGAEQRIRETLGRPENEKLFLLLPVGYPARDATVPYRTPLRKAASQLYSMV